MMNDYYRSKLQEGLEYQDFISDKLGISFYSSKKYQNYVGENRFGIEIKFDNRLKETGNIYIETSEKSSEDEESFTNSGIYREDNTCLYLIGNYEKAYLFSKKGLKITIENNQFKEVEIPTSKGVLIPVLMAEKISITIYKF